MNWLQSFVSHLFQPIHYFGITWELTASIRQPLQHCFSTFFVHGTLKVFKNKLAAHFDTLCSKTSIKRQVIPNSVAPLTPICGTLVCRGTPVGNLCSTSYSLSIFLYVKACIRFLFPTYFFCLVLHNSSTLKFEISSRRVFVS
jgi:hypothetical protein